MTETSTMIDLVGHGAPGAGVFGHGAFRAHEQVVHCHDPASRLEAIIAVHSSVLGPALGGVRFLDYGDTQKALADVLRLSEGMTYKAALAGLPHGGGKGVIIGPQDVRSEGLFRSFGRFVDSLGGRYITAEDVGTTVDDMDWIRAETPHVTGRSPARGGSGDPSPTTALGVATAMQAVARHIWDSDSLAGRHVVLIGAGKVGTALAGLLRDAGARLTVADVNEDAALAVARRFGAERVQPEEAHRIECDVLAPCALGSGLNPVTIPELACRAVVGAANNQLVDEACAGLLDDAGVVYVPDFVANAGGLIHVAAEVDARFDPSRVEARVRKIGDSVLAVLDAARIGGTTTADAAVRLAKARIRAATRP